MKQSGEVENQVLLFRKSKGTPTYEDYTKYATVLRAVINMPYGPPVIIKRLAIFSNEGKKKKKR